MKHLTYICMLPYFSEVSAGQCLFFSQNSMLLSILVPHVSIYVM